MIASCYLSRTKLFLFRGLSRYRMIITAAFMTSLVFITVSCSDEPAEKENDLKSTITEMARLLEMGEIDSLLSNYAVPQDIEVLKSEGRYEHVVNAFTDKYAGVLSRQFKHALTLEPTYSNDGSMAVFNDEALPKPLVFLKLNDKWYLKN